MNGPRQGRPIVGLVRALTGLGLLMVMITVGLIGWTLARVRTERALASTEQEQLTSASDALRQRAVESRVELQTVLDETLSLTNRPQVVPGLIQFIADLSDSQTHAAERPASGQFAPLIARLTEASQRGRAWRASYEKVWQDVSQQRTLGEVRALIHQLRSEVEALEGRRRLDDAIKHRRWRRATNDVSHQFARAILEDQGREQSQGVNNFNGELAECARLVELLGGEEQIDSLADLKDNKLKPVLDRLSRTITAFGAASTGAGLLTPQSIEQLKAMVFGTGPDGGGLFALRHDALRLRREREKIKLELAALFHDIETATASFAQSAQVRTAALTQQMEGSLAAGWHQMLYVGGGCSALFLWLAWVISHGIHGQVEAIDHARAEAEEGRRTTQKLMLEQQAAAAELTSAHKALQKSKQLQELIFNAVGEGIHWIDSEGRVVFENPTAARLLGWGLTELIGLPAHSTMHHTRADGSPYPQRECPIYAGLRDGKERRVDNEVFCRKDGTSFPVEYTSTPVREENGQIVGVVVVFADITERKRAEAELTKTQKELLEISRLAGMAEVATGVLHNVGNVLNSINVSATLIGEKVRKSRGANLAKVVTMFREHDTDLGAFVTTDAKGKQVPAFLALLSENLAAERVTLLSEVSQLQKDIGHIKDVVSMQQSYARVSGVTETLKVVDLVEDTLRMNAESLTRHDVGVVREFEEVSPITVDKHKILQILVNLVRNAKQSCDDSRRDDKQLTVRVTGDAERVRISVSDNGVGISPENLTRIFNHGFTTKKDGHGFGLHSGANAAKEMGGSLSVASEGLGRGATFTVELPLDPGARNPVPKAFAPTLAA